MSKKSITALKQTIRFSFFTLIVFCAVSCEDEPQVLGLNLIPDSDKVSAQYVDTFTVFAQTEMMENDYTGYNAIAPIGNLHDPLFGFTKANVLSEFYPYGIDSLMSDNPIFDSVKLVLVPYKYHGDSLADLTLNVYEYKTNLPEDSLLYSDFVIDRNNLENIGQTQYKVNDDAIEIILDSEFGNELLDPSGLYSFQELIDSFELFNKEFPGIYLETEDVSSKGGINYFQFSSVSRAYISLHYHYQGDTSEINVSEFFTFYDNLGLHKNLSLFEHDYTNATFDPVSGNLDSVIYLQSLVGTKGLLKIPGLDNLVNENTISVSSAKLILPLEDFDKSKHVFTPPNNISISAINSDNSTYEISDNSFITINSQSQVVNNYVDGTQNDSLGYVLNITRHIESILNQENENLGLHIFVANSLMSRNRQSLDRVVLSSHLNSNPIKLQIVYTKLSN